MVVGGDIIMSMDPMFTQQQVVQDGHMRHGIWSMFSWLIKARVYVALPPKPNTSIGCTVVLPGVPLTTSRMDIGMMFKEGTRPTTVCFNVTKAGYHIQQPVMITGYVLPISFVKDHSDVLKPASNSWLVTSKVWAPRWISQLNDRSALFILEVHLLIEVPEVKQDLHLLSHLPHPQAVWFYLLQPQSLNGKP